MGVVKVSVGCCNPRAPLYVVFSTYYLRPVTANALLVFRLVICRGGRGRLDGTPTLFHTLRWQSHYRSANLASSAVVSPAVSGGGGDEHRGSLFDHRRHLLCHRPRFLQAEGVQPEDGHGFFGRQPHLAGWFWSALLLS